VKRVVLTGATGFVGANLARRLILDGHDVHLLVRPGYRTWRVDGIREDVRIHEADLQDEERLRAILAGIRPAWIFHLAAYGAYPAQTDLDQSLLTNVLGTASLLSASLAVGFDGFVNAGSSSEYGFKDHAPAESEWLEPNSTYAVAKGSATLLCSYLGRRTGANITTLRLYSAFGPWEEPSRLIPTLIVRGLEGRFPRLAAPTIARDYIFVDDVVDAFVRAASRESPDPGAVYNIATGKQQTLADVVRLVASEFAIAVKPEWNSMPNRTWDTGIWIGDSTRARHDLSWRPEVDFLAGFLATVDWLRQDRVLQAFYSKHASR
jgi:nucleoside-diphosphate-sugar epimerase